MKKILHLGFKNLSKNNILEWYQVRNQMDQEKVQEQEQVQVQRLGGQSEVRVWGWLHGLS